MLVLLELHIGVCPEQSPLPRHATQAPELEAPLEVTLFVKQILIS